MSTPATIPVISPEGTPGDLPAEKWAEASQRGFKRATVVTSPEGVEGYIPADKAGLALQRGFKLGPKSQLDAGTPPPEGFTESLAGTVGYNRDMQGPSGKEIAAHALIGPLAGVVDAYRAAKGIVTNGANNLRTGIQENADAVKNIREGGPVGANLAKATLGNLYLNGVIDPLNVTGNVMKSGQQFSEGNPAGGFGTALGTAAQIEALKSGLQENPAAGAVEKPGLVRRIANTATETASEVKDALTAPENLSPEQAFTKAARPRNSIVGAKQSFIQGLPDARRALDSLGIDPTKMTLEDAEKAVSKAKGDIWGEYEQNYLGPNKHVGIDTSPVAAKIRATTEGMTDIQQRRLGNNYMDEVDGAVKDYDGKIQSMQQVETRIQELNNELRSQQSQFKVNEMALRRDPRFAWKFAELDGLREIEANGFNELSGPGAAELKARYGAQKVMEDVLQRRINVADRANPASLPQSIGRIKGAGKVVKGLATFDLGDVLEGITNLKAGENARLMNDPDYLIQQAFGKTAARPAAVIRPPQNFPQLPPGPKVTPPPADTTGTPLEPEYLPPPPDYTTRAMRQGRMLPQNTGGIPLQAGDETAPISGIMTRRILVRDPRTGQMRVMFVTGGPR